MVAMLLTELIDKLQQLRKQCRGGDAPVVITGPGSGDYHDMLDPQLATIELADGTKFGNYRVTAAPNGVTAVILTNWDRRL